MKRISSSTLVASLVASLTLASVAPALATPLDGAPQCGGEKGEKGGTSKPQPPPTPAPKPPA